MASSGTCGAHKPYQRKADAVYAASWHIGCAKCRTVGPLGVWVCLPSRQHWHCGHRKREPATAARPDLDALRAERRALDPHMEIDGGCREQMFLGDCEDCERWYVLDDQIRGLEMARR